MDSSFNINTINSTGGIGVLGTQEATYGDNQFLQLLTEQLRNQTPFEPVDSESFNSQMASYANMEEQRELNDNMLKLLDYQGVLARAQGLSQGSTLLGKNVEWVNENGSTGSDLVESVFVGETGDVQLRLASGETIDLRQVIGITETGSGSGESGSESGGENGNETGGENGGSTGGTGGSSTSGSSGGSSGSETYTDPSN